MADLQAIQQILGHEFGDPSLLRLALTHPSASGNQSKPSDDNQQMEFLGDAILQAVISETLYRLHPGKDEGHLTKARAGLVNGASLAAKAGALGLEQHLVLGRGQRAEFERGRESALEDALEAIVAALYLDGGLDVAGDFVNRIFADELADLESVPSIDNPKGELQERLQGGSGDAPTYELLGSSGPAHAREFEVAVQHAGREMGRGTGGSKKEAESRAAAAALDKLHDT
ncbi:MAG: ribonuclease III [Verrucomicrobiota bacterium]|nr:ribonuclease III [Verrucomicrobiota bacterium]MDP7050012.1 ribonuclease III [Verrucomicrobiota bacterium]